MASRSKAPWTVPPCRNLPELSPPNHITMKLIELKTNISQISEFFCTYISHSWEYLLHLWYREAAQNGCTQHEKYPKISKNIRYQFGYIFNLQHWSKITPINSWINAEKSVFCIFSFTAHHQHTSTGNVKECMKCESPAASLTCCVMRIIYYYL